jgi:hypothetical protein
MGMSLLPSILAVTVTPTTFLMYIWYVVHEHLHAFHNQTTMFMHAYTHTHTSSLTMFHQNMHTYIPTHTYIHTHSPPLRTCVSTYSCVCFYIYTHALTQMPRHIHTPTHTHSTHTHGMLYLGVPQPDILDKVLKKDPLHMQTYTHTHIYARTHTHTHTHTYTDRQTTHAAWKKSATRRF